MTPDTVSEGIARGHVLAREVGEFLIELAISLQKHAIYPLGHPALEAVSGRVLDRAGALLEHRPSLSLGVARTQLVIEGIATDAAHPVLRQLALRFHHHHLSALRFDRGLEQGELGDLLRRLSAEGPGERAQPLGLAETLPTWPHIRLSALGLGDLEIVEGEPGDAGSASRLWLDLARAALADDQADAAELEESDLSPSVVADAIERKSGSGTYDQVIAGYLIEITRAVGGAPGPDAAPLVERMNRLVRALNPDTLRRLMAHGGDRRQQREFIREAAGGLPVDAVVHLLSATADAAERPLSEFLLRMYEKLAMHAEGRTPAALFADGELRSHIQTLVDGWTLANPNPSSYGRALTAIASTPAAAGPKAPVEAIGADRMLKMCLELDFGGDALIRSVDRLVEEGRATVALELLAEAGAGRTTSTARARLGRIENLPALLDDAALDVERLVPVVERMGGPGLTALLDLLTQSEDRGVRRRAFDVLAALGPVVAPAADARLRSETRWYVLRNLLALHETLGTWPGLELDGLARHGDGRVRREALKLLLRDPDRRDATLARILQDSEARVVQLVRSAEGRALPPRTLGVLTRRIRDGDLPEPLRASLVRLLAWSAEVEARDALIGLAVRGRTLLGRLRLAPATPVALAALEVLADRWSGDPTAADVLKRALRGRDPAIRAAADLGRSS